jgi:uncharacterized protein (TIGR03000 family)
VELPSDAKLFVDDYQTKSTSARRVFSTPRLEPKHTYYYSLRAEAVRDGKTITQTKRVILHAGDVVRTSFGEFATTSTARADASR